MTLPIVPSRPEPATSGTMSKETEVGSVFVSNYPPYSVWSAEQVPRFLEALERPPAPDSTLGLYLHIPFCRKRCKFCYFRVYTDKDNKQILGYLDAMAKEARLLAAAPAIAGRPLEFVYFGGGTPSYLSVKQLEKLFGDVHAAISWDGAREITFECEPGTLQRSKLEALHALGVTRLSLGIENFDDAILRENGRAHTSEEIWRVLPWIREIGFPQLNIDLISGMVGERWESWRETVRRTVEVAPESVTLYQMELPFNTVYSHELEHGEPLPLASWDEKRAWHEYAFDELAKAGYERSSAYTMVRRDGAANGSGAAFVYRDLVWKGTDLAALGVASFGHLQGVHYQNVASWGEYLQILDEEERLPVSRALVTSADERLTRELILQLKKGRIALEPFRRKFGIDPAEHFAAPLAALAGAGMLRLDADRVELTPAGLLRVDALLPQFYAPEYRGARYT